MSSTPAEVEVCKTVKDEPAPEPNWAGPELQALNPQAVKVELKPEPITDQSGDMSVSKESVTDKEEDGERVYEVFDWDEYAANDTRAPAKCFNQSPTVPKNLFEEDMLLEMPDGRSGGDNLCLAQVIATFGPWVCTRMVGCDNMNDEWSLCDQSTLHPVGYCGSLGKSLTPPVGFTRSIGAFPAFLNQQLLDVQSYAPKSIFHPIAPEHTPTRNRFKVGHKLEVVDLRGGFTGHVSPATVAEVTGDEVTITFDGYSSGYNLKVRYDSRLLFPCRWAEQAKVPVDEVPKSKSKKRSAKKPTAAEIEQKRLMDEEEAELRRKVQANMELIAQAKAQLHHATQPTRKKKKRKDKEQKQTTTNTEDQPSATTPTTNAETVSPAAPTETGPSGSVGVKVTEQSSPASPTSSSSTPKATDWVARARKSLPAATPPSNNQPKMNQSQSKCLPSGPWNNRHDPLNRSSAPQMIPKTQPQLLPEQQAMVYLNVSCSGGINLNREQLKKVRMPQAPEPLSQLVRHALQQVTNCATQPLTVLKMIPGPKLEALKHGPPSAVIAIAAEIAPGERRKATLPSRFVNRHHAALYLQHFLSNIHACKNLLTLEPVQCSLCPTPGASGPANNSSAAAASASLTGSQAPAAAAHSASANKTVKRTSTSTGAGAAKRTKTNTHHHDETSDDNSSDGVRSRPSSVAHNQVLSWSVQNVCDALQELADPTITNAFRACAIDGKALFLLTTDLMIKHMSLPLGPALKVLSADVKMTSVLSADRPNGAYYGAAVDRESERAHIDSLRPPYKECSNLGSTVTPNLCMFVCT